MSVVPIMLSFVLAQPVRVHFISSLTLCLTTIHPVTSTLIGYLGCGILCHQMLLIWIRRLTISGRSLKDLCGLTSFTSLSHQFLVPTTSSVPVVNVVTHNFLAISRLND